MTAAMPLRPRTEPRSASRSFLQRFALWWGRDPRGKASALPDSTEGYSRMDAAQPTRPLLESQEAQRNAKAPARSAPAATPSSQRVQRMARREQVFQLVRESMVRSGVLSSGYKFKVLSLDQRGTTFLVMMDLAAEFGGQTERLAEIEALIAQSAKHRYNLLVQAVYWRFNEHVVLGQPDSPHAAQPHASTSSAAALATGAAATVAASAVVAAAPARPYEPLDLDEVTAFKRALQAGISPALATEKASTAKNSGLLLTGFEETEMADDNQGMPALSATQYGDLPAH